RRTPALSGRSRSLRDASDAAFRRWTESELAHDHAQALPGRRVAEPLRDLAAGRDNRGRARDREPAGRSRLHPVASRPDANAATGGARERSAGAVCAPAVLLV